MARFSGVVLVLTASLLLASTGAQSPASSPAKSPALSPKQAPAAPSPSSTPPMAAAPSPSSTPPTAAAPSPSSIAPSASPSSSPVADSPPSLPSSSPVTVPSSVSGSPSEAPVPANGAVLNQFSAAGALAVGVFAAVISSETCLNLTVALSPSALGEAECLSGCSFTASFLKPGLSRVSFVFRHLEPDLDQVLGVCAVTRHLLEAAMAGFFVGCGLAYGLDGFFVSHLA
ncbi:hypothetical protein ACFX1Q_030517 [Malus domestica]